MPRETKLFRIPDRTKDVTIKEGMYAGAIVKLKLNIGAGVFEELQEMLNEMNTAGTSPGEKFAKLRDTFGELIVDWNVEDKKNVGTKLALPAGVGDVPVDFLIQVLGELLTETKLPKARRGKSALTTPQNL